MMAPQGPTSLCGILPQCTPIVCVTTAIWHKVIVTSEISLKRLGFLLNTLSLIQGEASFSVLKTLEQPVQRSTWGKTEVPCSGSQDAEEDPPAPAGLLTATSWQTLNDNHPPKLLPDLQKL